MNDFLLEPEASPEDYAFSRLLAFVKYQYQDYIIGKHHAYIAKCLESVETGDLDRLIITTPPRHGKTMLASEYFSSWFLGRNPKKQVIFSTYSQERAGDVGRKVRNQLQDPGFKRIFPGCNISKDSQSISNVGTQQGGNFFAVGLGSAITGRGAHILLIDDPIKGQDEANSNLFRTKMKDWYRSTAYTRLMPGASAIVIIQTRWDCDDLVGWLTKDHADEGWVVINFPALAVKDNDALDRMAHEALWPKMFSKKRLERIRNAVGTRTWNALYQGNPVGQEGSIVKYEWLKKYEKKPEEFKRIVQSWDTSFKASQLNDPSVCITFGETKDSYYVLDVFRDRLEYPDLKRMAVQLYKKWEPSTVICEDRASGQSLIQDLKRNTRMPIIPIKAENDKVTRLSSVTGVMEAGKFLLPEDAPWLLDYETELTSIPFSRHDDMADATSQYLRYATKSRHVPGKNSRFWK